MGACLFAFRQESFRGRNERLRRPNRRLRVLLRHVNGCAVVADVAEFEQPIQVLAVFRGQDACLDKALVDCRNNPAMFAEFEFLA